MGWLIRKRKRKRNAKRKNVQTGKGVNVFVMANRLDTVIESRYKIGEIKPSLFVKKLLYIFLVLMSFTTGNSYSLEDDFIVVSDQKTLDQLIRKNENPND